MAIDFQEEVDRVVTQEYIENMTRSVGYASNDYDPVDTSIMTCLIKLNNGFEFTGYSAIFNDCKDEAYSDALRQAINAEKYAMWVKLNGFREKGAIL